MHTRIVRHGDADSFLRRASSWLLQTEAENNLVLGIAQRAHAHPELYVATVEQDGAVVGCALRTPPRKLLLTRMPPSAVDALAFDVAACFDDLPAVHGPPVAAREFARHWCDRHGCTAHEAMEQRVYALRQVRDPERLPPGELRFAEAQDVGLITSWVACFAMEARVEMPATRDQIAEHIAAGQMALWWDEHPRTLAAYAGRSPHGVRIGPVYTPPEWRGRGYAGACVAALSRRALEEGADFCCLYTDLANPTSNALYERLGYSPVCDAVDIDFVAVRPD
ncbi:MAG TPA: GNAT family N-acetyltransferase [Longimicrobiales bacterium]